MIRPGTLLLAAAAGLAFPSAAEALPTREKPTVILVHGAFADSSSWDPVATRLLRNGYKVIAAAAPLRSVKGDAAYISSIVAAQPGPVVLAGHSYGGAVISAATAPAGKIKSLVYVAGFALEAGESGQSIADKFPEGTLGQALAPPIRLDDGSQDLYILPAKFWGQFAADLPEAKAANMAVTQRPVTLEALNEPAVATAWKTTPSWFIYGSLDKNIPRRAHAFMADRARARETMEVKGSSHVVMLSHPAEVAAMIERAASAPD